MEQTANYRAQRYLVVGCGGSGKSTLARKVAEVEGLPYIDTDALYWTENWKLQGDAQVLARLPLSDDAWVLDGNFVDAVDEVWSAADRVIWLNYSRSLIFQNLLRRNFLWWIGRSAAWNGKRMPLGVALSGLRHFAGQYPRIQKTFPEFLRSLPDGKVLIFTTRKQCEEWLASLSSKRS